MTLSKTELLKKSSGSEEIDAPKEWLLCWSSFSEQKAAPKKSLNMPQGKLPFEKKIPS